MLETLQTCDELIKAGKIQHIGTVNDSAWGVNQFIKLAEQYSLPRIQSLQNEYNLLRRRDETDVMETCGLEDISYLTWSPLEQGVITGKYRNGARPVGTRMSIEILDLVKRIVMALEWLLMIMLYLLILISRTNIV